MDFIVYASGDEKTLLLVPGCMLPPIAAQVTYGPLSVCGRLNSRDGGAKLWRKFAAEVDAHSFAVVSVAEAERLLGSEHPLLQQCRKSASRLQPTAGRSQSAEAAPPAGDV
jgi:hypothetical protein